MLEGPSTPSVPPDPHPLLELADWIEQTALSDLYAAAPAALQRSLGLFVDRVAGALVLGAPGLSSASISRVFVHPDASAAAAGSALDRMRKAGVRSYFAHAHERASSRLEATFAERGLGRYHRPWIKLARDRSPLDQAPPSSPGGDLEVAAARSDQADDFAEIVVRCTEVDPAVGDLLSAVVRRPRWHVYFATLAGRPVATGALFVQGDVGYLGYGATLPEHRNQGLQRTLLAKRIRVALALGCRVIVSETGVALPGRSNPSYDNMVSLGLVPIGVRDNFVLDGVRWG